MFIPSLNPKICENSYIVPFPRVPMKCPACGHEQNLTDTCVNCGIVFSKYYEIQNRKVKKSPETNSITDGELSPSISQSSEATGFISSLFPQISSPWSTVSTSTMAIVSFGFATVICFLVTTDLRSMGSSLVLFMVHNVNLVFHEAGHWIFGVFGSETLTILGGSLNQILIPLVVAVSFWGRRDTVGFVFGVFWMFENFIDVSVYMADARALELPLIGGLGEEAHDWRNLFMRWGLLAKDTVIAGYVRKIGWFGMVYIWVWLIWRWFVDRGRSESAGFGDET